MRLWPVFVLLFACGASQSGDRGPTFCKSYEDQYLVGCQQHCEGEYPEDDREAPRLCAAKCLDDLKDDSEFKSSCPEQRKQLK